MEKIKEWLKGFLKGAFEDTLFESLEKEATETQEMLLTLLFLNFAGLENPFSFYLFELLPYMEINEHFLRRMLFKEERLPVLFSRFEGWA
ncbi:MAG: hypothetical protein J7L62_06250 [Candidatus Aminicenantes bacterium]|nr:hypothetical protein [Candidatus Aminicenantes bacterium]